MSNDCPRDTIEAPPPTTPTGTEPPRVIADAGEDPYDGVEVPCVRTPLDDISAVDVIRVGHLLAFGVTAQPGAAAVAWAHWCEETGRGKGMRCWNVGNQDVTDDYTGDWCYLTAGEGKARTDMRRHKLRAFTSAEAGAKDYWLRLAKGYPRSLASFATGSGGVAAHALHDELYYTGDVSEYAAALESLVREYHRRFPQVMP